MSFESDKSPSLKNVNNYVIWPNFTGESVSE